MHFQRTAVIPSILKPAAQLRLLTRVITQADEGTTFNMATDPASIPESTASVPATSPTDNSRHGRRAFLGTAASAAIGTLLADRFAAATPAALQLSTNESITGSAVGSLFPFIDSQAVKTDFPLSYLNEKFISLSDWQHTARGRLLELLHYAPPACSPGAEIIDRQDLGDCICEKVTFNTTPSLRVPAVVLIPKNAAPPYPAIVALHDHGGFYLWGKEKLLETAGEHAALREFRQKYYGGKSLAIELVRQGYLVIVIDMFYWGERRMLLDPDPAEWRDRSSSLTGERVREFNKRAGQSEPLVARTIYAAGFTWPGVIFWDDRRTIDYLVSRPDVDRNRIGCVGLSVGGFRSCHLAALDERIKVAVAVGWMTSFPWQLRNHVLNTIGHTMIVPGLYRELDYPDVAALAAPTPLLVINGSQDQLFHPDGVQAAFEKLHACYVKAGAKDHCVTRLYDAPHEFNVAMQEEAWAWIKRWL